jgi:ABC-type Fe3+ transport system permease subunit
MSKSPARNSAFPAISIVVMALLAFVIWPIYSVFEAAWTGRESSEPGLSVSSQHVPLALHTVKLLFLVLAIALPTGSLTALFIFRTNAPAKWLWRVLILLPALVPLDLHATVRLGSTQWRQFLGSSHLRLRHSMRLKLS